MMKHTVRPWIRDVLLGAMLLLAALALVVRPQQSAQAVREGLDLCGNVIIPSLFPFFVLSSLVVELGLAGYMGRALEGVMRPLFGVPGSCASALVLGLIGGYPVGARTAVSLYEAGMCSKTEGERLLAFCNNCGPGFILGVAGAGVFRDGRIGLLLYLVHAAAAVCVGVLFRFYKREQSGGTVRGRQVIHTRRLSAAFTGSVKSALFSMLNICAYVVFFTVLTQMLTAAGALDRLAGPWGRKLLTGVLEISSGVCVLAEGGSLEGRVVLAAFVLGWAGISVHCQVLSLVGDSGLSAKPYLIGKLLHGGLSAVLAAAMIRVVPLQVQASSGLAQPAEEVLSAGFSAAVAASFGAICVLCLSFFVLVVVLARKSSRKRRKSVV